MNKFIFNLREKNITAQEWLFITTLLVEIIDLDRSSVKSIQSTDYKEIRKLLDPIFKKHTWQILTWTDVDRGKNVVHLVILDKLKDGVYKYSNTFEEDPEKSLAQILWVLFQLGLPG